ncbi:MAG: hypothetical protein GXP25_08890 [Planctomycetes bacterium]|nr:hypothetical protein [Planctomycetota bacterium]
MDRQGIHLPDFPLPAKLLCTAVFILIGVGILVSEAKVVLKYRMVDGKPGFSVQDLILSFHGHPGAPLVEVKLRLAPSADHKEFQKPMYKEQVDYLIKWTKEGCSASEEDFAPVVEMIENNCVNCHDPDAVASSTPFWVDRTVKHDLVAPVFSRSGAISATRLVHLTHIHLLSNVMIFALTGIAVLFCRTRSGLKAVLVLLPLIAVALDIGSWWLTAYVSYLFAYALMLSGGLMGLAFLLQFLFVMHGLWLQRPQAESA